MKRKTISKVIKNKFLEWKESITDESIRNDLLKNVMVSGGCISSMFLREQVNDFDIYIKDIDFLKRLAEYYCTPLKKRVLDGRDREKYIDEFRRGFDGEVDDWYVSKDYVFIKNLHPEQIKIYIGSGGERFPCPKDKDDKEIPYQVVFLSQNAISLSGNIQIVTRFSGTIDEIHKNYDFVHATNYYTPDTGLVVNESALECILTKELRYQGSLYPLTSIIRMKKFILRGWTINAGEILKIMFQISELNLKDITVLEEQLIGVDVAYFSKLLEILQGVKKEDITSAYLNKIIDKVFGETDEEF